MPAKVKPAPRDEAEQIDYDRDGLKRVAKAFGGLVSQDAAGNVVRYDGEGRRIQKTVRVAVKFDLSRDNLVYIVANAVDRDYWTDFRDQDDVMYCVQWYAMEIESPVRAGSVSSEFDDNELGVAARIIDKLFPKLSFNPPRGGR